MNARAKPKSSLSASHERGAIAVLPLLEGDTILGMDEPSVARVPAMLRLLESPQVFFHGQSIHLTAQKPIFLLLYLALKHDWGSRDELAVVFYPEDMDYPSFKAKGYPIGSGQVEAMNKNVIGNCLKRSGSRLKIR